MSRHNNKMASMVITTLQLEKRKTLLLIRSCSWKYKRASKLHLYLYTVRKLS